MNNIFFLNNFLRKKQVDEVFLLKTTINIFRYISALSRHQKLRSFVPLIFNKIIQNSIDDFLWFPKPEQRACIDMIDPAWFQGLS